MIGITIALSTGLPSFASVRPARLIKPPSANGESEIRVRVNEGASVVRVRGYDLRIYDQSSGTSPGGRHLAVASDRESDWEFRCEDGRIRAQRLGGAGASSFDLAEPAVIRSPSGFIQYQGKPYREELRIFTAGSLCEVVNQVDLEKYLEGLVNAEFSSRWNEESIGAQVVAARTYALFQIRQARTDNMHYDIDSSTHDQVYDGSMKEDVRSARVVEKTRGWVLTVKTKKGVSPLKAYYHSTCGGITELPDKVWGTSNAGFRRVVCPYCAHSPRAHWSFDLTAAEITDSLRRAGRSDVTDFSKWPKDWKLLLDKGHLRSIRIGSYDPSGRVEQVSLSFGVGSLGAESIREWTMSGARFRQWVGPAKFMSTSFQLQLVSPNGRELSWRFTGRGNGHGVGMCQYGAKTMGEKGFKTAAILKFYYPDAVMKKLW
jgi:stage II sporulation protein D